DVDDVRWRGARLIREAVHIVVADHQLILRREVEVGADEDLVAVATLAELVEAAGVVAVLLLGDVEHLLNFRGMPERLPGRAAGREPVRRRLPAEIEVAEVERLVLDDWAAEAESALLILEAPDGRRHRLVSERADLADEPFVASEPVGRAGDVVAAAAGD